MSDVVPSFFPTPHEIAGGIRWMREHPVVATAAAAAATAVSVLTYLKSRADEEERTEPLDKSVVTTGSNSSGGAASADDCSVTRERFQTWSDSYEPQDDDPCAAPLTKTSTTSRSSDDLLATAAPKLCRRPEPTSDDVYSSTESEVSTTSPTVRRSHPSSSSVSNFAFSCQDDDDSVMTATATTLSPSSASTVAGNSGVPSSLRFAFPESVLEEEDENSTSPQWGWYVSTTPPEDRYT